MKRAYLLSLYMLGLFAANNALAAGYSCDTTYILCFNKYHMDDNNLCQPCPAGSYCNSGESAGTETSKLYSCADKTGNPLATSDALSDDIYDCYLTCDDKKIYWAGDASTFKCSDCEYNEKPGVNGCEPCDVEHALSYVEGGGNCVVKECVAGYTPYGTKCVINNIECTDEITNAAYAEKAWSSELNGYGTCTVTTCDDGYHVANNTCVADTESCQLPHGIGEREWNHDTNQWNKCIATQCDPGYTNDASETNAIDPTQCGECANAYGDGGKKVVSSYVSNCEIATCMNQGEQYALIDNQCKLICTGEDETGRRYWDGDKCVHECADGYSQW